MSDVRKLVYQNVACGVPPEKVAHDLGLTDEQAKDAFDEVARKIAWVQVKDAMPYLPCQSINDAMQNRKALLPILENMDLDAPEIAKVIRVTERQTRQV
ncbi:hypothetical protein [Paraburkholderia sp.]|uniref:hypothetical protein n=1 Tax=Paraburkholderia sp. TaxID=1926495 RepID=UPI003C7CBFA9